MLSFMMNVVRESQDAISLEIEYGTTRMIVFDPCLVSKQEWLRFCRLVEKDKNAYIEHYIDSHSFFFEFHDDEFTITLDSPTSHCQIVLEPYYKQSVLSNIQRFTKNINANVDWKATVSDDDYLF